MTNFTPTVVKCGFPTDKLEKYLKLLSPHPISIVDQKSVKTTSPNDYICNNNVKQLLDEIKKIDVNNLSISEAFDLLFKFQNKANKIEETINKF